MASTPVWSESALRARLSPERGRSAVSVDQALAAARARSGTDFSRARARVGYTRGHLLDAVIELPGGRASAEEQRASLELVELLIGEACAADWLGDVTLIPAPRGGALSVVQARPGSEHFFPLAELGTTFAAAIAGLYAGFPGDPYWSLGGEQRWVLLELDVEAAEDYPAQSDVALASTFLPEMLKCFLAGDAFASRRFSRHGEIFAYLKSERRGGDVRRAVAERRVLEDAFDAALVSERAGRVVGSGMGVAYTYVNFAFHAVDRAVEAIRSVATRVGLPERSWILFFDSALADVWIPVREGAGKPPT